MRLLIALIAVISFASCSDSPNVRCKVQYYHPIDRYRSSVMQIMDLDSMYHVGDTVRGSGSVQYIIVAKGGPAL